MKTTINDELKMKVKQFKQAFKSFKKAEKKLKLISNQLNQLLALNRIENEKV